MPDRRVALFAAVGLMLAAARAGAQDDFEAFKRKDAESLRAYLTRDDAEFADFLKQDWREFTLSVAGKALTRPKPKTTPIARSAPVDSVAARPASPAATVNDSTVPPAPAASDGASVVVPAPGVSAIPSGSSMARPVAPAIWEPANAVSASFFGSRIAVPAVALKVKPLPARVTANAISTFWEQMSASPYGELLAALRRQGDQLRLGDWAFAQLLFRAGLTLAAQDTSLAQLITWHLLVKSGYATRVGYNESQIYILLKTDETLYGASYFTIDGARYYVLDLASGPPPKVGSIYTYDRDHPDARKPHVFSMTALPFVPNDPDSRTLRFSYGGKDYRIAAGVNRNLVHFLANYPQTRLGGYLDADVPSDALDSIVKSLRPIIAGRSELEQVNMLLRFVQTAFDYKTDDEQFAREKWMFPEETLFYPFSDCEDRAILFSFLVRRLLPSVEVVGLVYPDHVAAAVRFGTDVPGDAHAHRGRRFLVADPTYVNANAGMEMPQYRGVAPTIVEVRPLPR